MSIRVFAADPFVLDLKTRMPFRYGIVTVDALPHLFLRVDAEIDGRRQVGVAADNLAPKWFTKDPASSVADDVAEMIVVVESACAIARAVPRQPTVFRFSMGVYQAQAAWGGGWGKPPLLSHLGTSLVERAVVDAFCKARNVPFQRAVRANTLGVDLGQLHPELDGSAPADWLPAEPLRSIAARHTVGLIDPLTDAEIAPEDRLDDGLPQSLEACVGAYGLTRFKIKLGGDAAADLDRVRRLADVIGRAVPGGFGNPDVGYTFDANENFADVDAFRTFWDRLTAEPSLEPFLSKLVLVEQPLHRAAAMTPAVGRAFAAWPDRPPMIVDESDGEFGTARAALALGYVGTSYKSCKGVLKGLANTCLIASRNRAAGGEVGGAGGAGPRFHISGEDLSNVGPVALLQDLAAVAALGIGDVERNGHHYFRGLSALPADVQATVAAAHPDVYGPTSGGFPAVRIAGGRIDVGSVVDAPFGTGFEFDPGQFTPAADWALGAR